MTLFSRKYSWRRSYNIPLNTTTSEQGLDGLWRHSAEVDRNVWEDDSDDLVGATYFVEETLADGEKSETAKKKFNKELE